VRTGKRHVELGDLPTLSPHQTPADLVRLARFAEFLAICASPADALLALARTGSAIHRVTLAPTEHAGSGEGLASSWLEGGNGLNHVDAFESAGTSPPPRATAP